MYTVQCTVLSPEAVLLVVKGTGSRDRFQKYFDKNGYFSFLIRTLTCFVWSETLKMSLWCAVFFVFFQSVKEEHMGEILFIWVRCQNYLPALLDSYWLVGWSLDSYWSIIPAPEWVSSLIKAHWRAADKWRNFCAVIDDLLTVHKTPLFLRIKCLFSNYGLWHNKANY